MATANDVFSGFSWFNQPKEFTLDKGVLELKTEADTDFWQRTHYGFRRHNGHAFVQSLPDHFSLSVKAEFFPEDQYDQCGLIILVDEDNWAKISVEYETEDYSRLGSVVTNLGYSDWATTDISSLFNHMYYRLHRCGNDFLIEHSMDGDTYKQMRIFHLHADLAQAKVGLYACSPEESSSFTARFLDMEIGTSTWE